MMALRIIVASAFSFLARIKPAYASGDTKPQLSAQSTTYIFAAGSA